MAKATPVDHVRRGLEPLLLCLYTVLAYCRADSIRSFSDLTDDLFLLRVEVSNE